MASFIDWNVASTAATPVSPSRELARELDDSDDAMDGDGVAIVVVVVAVAAVIVGALIKVKAALASVSEGELLTPLALPAVDELQDVTPAKQVSPPEQPYPRGQDWMHEVEASS